MCKFNGENWNTAKLDAENRGDFHFVDSKLGWHVGSSIMRTKDGGRTWQYVLQDKDERNRAFSGLNLDGVVFADNKRGWAWGPTSIYKTTDAGETWTDVAGKLFLILKN